MSERMVRKIVCDYDGCPNEVIEPVFQHFEEDVSDRVLLPDGWLAVIESDQDFSASLHFCSLECLAQWAASKVGKSLIAWKLEAGAYANPAAACANGAIPYFSLEGD